MTKMLRIEGCAQCYHMRQTYGFGRRCTHPDVVELDADKRQATYSAWPAWCPLPDAPAWPRVAEADEEREGEGILEAIIA